MEKKQKLHNLIILDESGSMLSIKNSIIQGFNELVQTIKGIEKQFPEQEHFITYVSFNRLEIKEHHFNKPASKLKQLSSKNYNPNSMTPLYDAMGLIINKLNEHLKIEDNYKVLVTILTDGEENASKEYSIETIKELVDELSQQNWTFTYIGTDHDVEKVARSLSITNALLFKKNDSDIKAMFKKEKKARMRFSAGIFKDSNSQTSYFSD